MNCTQAEGLASSFIDGEISAVDESPLFAHLSTCDSCCSFLQRIVRLRSSLTSTPNPTVPVSLDRKVHRLSLRPTDLHTIAERFWRRRFSIPSPVFAMLIVLFAVSITLSIASLFPVGAHPHSEETQVVYIMNLEPIEVQGVPAQPQAQ
jgi:anti-sigma factor RsiW